MALPCLELAKIMWEAEDKVEECWEDVFVKQFKMGIASTLTISSCAAVLPLAGTGNVGAAYLAMTQCAGGFSLSFLDFIEFIMNLDVCEDLINDGAKKAGVWSKCAAKHKDVLNAAAAANAANS